LVEDFGQTLMVKITMDKTPHAPKNSALATASITLGCIGLVCAMFLPFVLVVPAVICGHLAQKRIRASNGRLGGQSRAATGLVTGYIGLVASVIGFIILSVAIPGFHKAKEKVLNEAARENAHILAAASLNYAKANGNRLPFHLSDLRPYVMSPNVFDSPLEQEEDNQPDYEFLMPGKSLEGIENPGQVMVLKDLHPVFGGGEVVAYADGHAAIVFKSE
jgi:hypothetical protein